jgi:4-coumarate--CoA ligase
MNSSFAVAAGLRCTLANNAYNARELRHQYIDSGAMAIFSSEDGVATSREMLKDLGLSAHEADKRIFVMSNCLAWAGGPSIPLKPGLSGLLQVSDFFKFGTLEEEEKFDGELAYETVYLCYSSGSSLLQFTLRKFYLISQVRPGNQKVLRYDVRNTSTAPN